jgi:hypothetical protein
MLSFSVYASFIDTQFANWQFQNKNIELVVSFCKHSTCSWATRRKAGGGVCQNTRIQDHTRILKVVE